MLMRLAGFERPVRGQVGLDGKPVQLLPPHQRERGVVFQSHPLAPRMPAAQRLPRGKLMAAA